MAESESEYELEFEKPQVRVEEVEEVKEPANIFKRFALNVGNVVSNSINYLRKSAC